MGVKKNGTKKRKIRGGELIKGKKSFWGPGRAGVDNTVESVNYGRKALNSVDETIANLTYLVQDAYDHVNDPNKDYKKTTQGRVNIFVKAMLQTNFVNDEKWKEGIHNLLKARDFLSLLDATYREQIKQLTGYNPPPPSTSDNHNMLLSEENVKNKSSASGGPSLGAQSVDLDTESVDSDNPMYMPMDLNSVVESEDSDNTNAPISRTGLASAITNVDGLPWGQNNPSSEIEPVKNYNTLKSDFQLFGKDNKRYGSGFVPNIDEYKKSANKYLKGIKDDIIRIKNENDKLKQEFDFEFEKRKQELSRREKTAEEKVKTLLAELTSEETAYKTRETFLNTQRAVLQRYIDRFKNPNITLAVAMSNSEQASDLIQAVIYCINLSSSIPLDSDYYYVTADTKLEDIKIGNFKPEKVTDQAFIDIVKQEYNPTNTTKFQSLTTYKSMFQNLELNKKATQIKTYKELLTKLQNVLKPLLPFNSKIAVTNGGSFVGDFLRRRRSVNSDLETALQNLYKSYSDINTETLNTRDLEDINNQLKKAIEFFENTKIKKDGFAVTKDININGDYLSPGNVLNTDYIKPFEYQSSSASSSMSASGGPALPRSSGGSRKRKSPKKSARKTNKKQ